MILHPYAVSWKDDWCLLAFARTAREARLVGFRGSPVYGDDAPYIDARAKRLPDAAFAVPDVPGVIDGWTCEACPDGAYLDYDTGRCTCGEPLTFDPVRPVALRYA